MLQSNLPKTYSSLVDTRNSGQKWEHLCLQSYRMDSDSLKCEAYIYLLVGCVKKEGFFPEWTSIRLNERRIVLHMLIWFTCFCAHLFRCKLVYDTINRQPGESATNDTVPPKKKKVRSLLTALYKSTLCWAITANQRNILYFHKKIFLSVKFPFW